MNPTPFDPVSPDSGTPAPRIMSPAPNAVIPAGQTLTVTFTTNHSELNHQLILIDRNNPSMIVGSVTLSAPVNGTGTISVPTGAKDYYLGIRIDPSQVVEQYSHLLVVKAQ